MLIDVLVRVYEHLPDFEEVTVKRLGF